MTKRNTLRLLITLTCLSLLATSAMAAQGTLRTRVDPRVAGVFIDGKYHGTAAMFSHHQAAIKLDPGTYTVKLVDPMHQDMTLDVGITSGKETTIRQQMKPLNVPKRDKLGELETEDWGNSAIYLNGKYYANSNELDHPSYSLLLDPGEFNMKLVPVDGSKGLEAKITIKEGQTLVLAKGKANTYRK